VTATLTLDPCRIEGEFVRPCKMLTASIDRKRVELLVIADMNTFTHKRNMVVLKAGRWAKRGIVMNYCPFCGANIAEHVKARLAEEGREGREA